jgi:hypothetical protein
MVHIIKAYNHKDGNTLEELDTFKHERQRASTMPVSLFFLSHTIKAYANWRLLKTTTYNLHWIEEVCPSLAPLEGLKQYIKIIRTTNNNCLKALI